MTPAELESLVLNSKDSIKLQTAFAPLSEQERKSLSTTANKLKTQLYRGVANKDASPALRKYLANKPEYHWNSPAYYNVGIALFALCPISVIKKSDIYTGGTRDVLEQVVLDRKPEWLDEWIEHDVEKEFSTVSFSMIRRWYREGICKKPVSDGYIRKFAWEMMYISYNDKEPEKPPLSERLLAEPDMLDDVWRLFELENQAFNTDGWITKHATANYESWPDALVKLSDKGHLDRQRLLDASLKGLLIDLKQNQLSGFHKFHERLSPTKEELQARQGDYLALMTHTVGHVINFALKMASLMAKHNVLDRQAFLCEIPALFMHEGKGNAVTALKMIGRILSKDEALLSTGMSSLIEGLKHVHVDVQGKAIEIISKYKSKITELHQEELLRSLDFVSAAIKPEVTGLIGDKITIKSDLESDESVSDESLEESLASLSKREKDALGLGDLEKFSPTKSFLPSISGNIMDHAVLPTLKPLKPIDSLDELISAVSHAVEITETADLVEQILDGISRFCDQFPKDFRSKVSPLRTRLEKGGGLGTSNGIANYYGGFRLAIADLILTWLTGDFYRSSKDEYSSESNTLEFSITRVRDITDRVAKKQAQQLMATPTHTGGWIDPLVWIDRIVSCEENNITYDRMDFCLSFLRLTPDNRNEARRHLSRLSGRVRRVVDFALGGDVSPEYDERVDYDIWISAARGRSPYANWADFFKPFKLDDVWPDSYFPAIYRWRAFTQEKDQYKFAKMEITVTSEGQEEVKEEKERMGSLKSAFNKIGKKLSVQKETVRKFIPSASLNHYNYLKYNWSSDINTTWVVQWLTCQWPLNPEAVYMLGADQMVRRIDMDSSNWEPSYGFFYGLFENNRPWREPAHLLLCMGLIAKDADSSGLAIDALVEGIEHGRVEIPLLINVLVKLADGGWLKLNRLAENLLKVSQVSLAHAWAVSHIIQGWLQNVSLTQHNMYKMLEVLLEVQSHIEEPLDAKVSEIFSTLKGSNKTTKLAKQLQNLKYTEHTKIENIKNLAVKTRIAHYKQDRSK